MVREARTRAHSCDIRVHHFRPMVCRLLECRRQGALLPVDPFLFAKVDAAPPSPCALRSHAGSRGDDEAGSDEVAGIEEDSIRQSEPRTAAHGEGEGALEADELEALREGREFLERVCVT